jgi:hypothetical protein
MTMHFFEVEEAMKYGVESAILLTNIRFWLTKNKANQTHIHDGYYWTYNSAKAFTELFPYMPRRSISMYLKKLCDLGVLKSGNYNDIKYDRTTWYTIPAEFAVKPPQALNLAIGENCQPSGQIRQSNGENSQPIGQIRPPIPDSKPDINTDAAAGSLIKKPPKTEPGTITEEEKNQSLANEAISLNETQQKCLEWAKSEPYWSSRVYSEKAFLRHYNAKSGALRGQYQKLVRTQQNRGGKKGKTESSPSVGTARF